MSRIKPVPKSKVPRASSSTIQPHRAATRGCAGNEFALVRIPVLMGNLGEGSPPPTARWREMTFKSEQIVRARGTDLGRVMRRGMKTGVNILQRKRCG